MGKKFLGFCKRTEQQQARRIMEQRRKLFRRIVEETGNVEMAEKILSDRPHTKYIPGVGYVVSSQPDLDISELEHIASISEET